MGRCAHGSCLARGRSSARTTYFQSGLCANSLGHLNRRQYWRPLVSDFGGILYRVAFGSSQRAIRV